MATNAHLDEVASIIEGMFEADRFVPLEVPKSVVRLRIDDQSTDIANLVNGSHIDTNMEKFLYGRIKRQKHKLKWTSKILETYVHGTNTGNFVPLEKYVQSMTLEEENFDDVNVDEICYVLVKYIRHSDYSALERTDQSRLSAMGMYYCCCMFAAVIPWAGESEYQKRLDTLMAQYHNIKQDTDVTEDILDSIGRDVREQDETLALRSDYLVRAEEDSRRMSLNLTRARVEMWSMLTLVLTVNVCFGFLYLRRNDWCKKYRGYIMFVAVAGMTAMSIRTVMHTLATKETFIDASVNIDMNAGIEHFDKVIPSNFVLSADDIVYKTSLAKERKYNKAVMDGVIEEKKSESTSINRKRVAAEHMYSNYRFKERHTYRSSGVLQLSLTLTLLIILITVSSSKTSNGMVIAMYIVVLALVAFLYGVMYRTDSKRMRHNWEKIYYQRN
jgi:hypothetical protein